MNKQQINFQDLGNINYKSAWDYQEILVKKNLEIKKTIREYTSPLVIDAKINNKSCQPYPSQEAAIKSISATTNYLLFCEHPAVYTLGKSGHMENVLLSEQQMQEKKIEFFKTNRGGDITFHGPQQIVGYPIIDLENFYTDIGKYLRNLEEVIIFTIAEYGVRGDRSKGETGVWIEPGVPGRERKICAIGIRCSRWITMHGFALNVNTDLSYFDHIIPCGIVNKQVTSLKKELTRKVDMDEIKIKLKKNFERVFNVDII